MTTDEKLAAILAAVQTDPGHRGLARDPHDNLFTVCPSDFAAACRSIVTHTRPSLGIVTGFFIPTADPPAYETDGPPGAVFLAHAFRALGLPGPAIATDPGCVPAVWAGLRTRGVGREAVYELPTADDPDLYAGYFDLWGTHGEKSAFDPTHYLFIERVGPNRDGQCLTMRGRDVTAHTRPAYLLIDELEDAEPGDRIPSIGIGDGGNEIGMGKVPHETVVKNIPNGDLIHCRVPTDYLIVAGVSNWGAYALAAGVYVLRGVRPPADLFDPDREREILEVMVREGPLVDGVTGKPTATVDGLPWGEYAMPLIRIREILKS
jgi:hypothetical protein